MKVLGSTCRNAASGAVSGRGGGRFRTLKTALSAPRGDLVAIMTSG
jgi:hypothetical protein